MFLGHPFGSPFHFEYHFITSFFPRDAKNMAKNVYQTFIGIFEAKQNMTAQEAMAYVKELRAEERYLEDIWT